MCAAQEIKCPEDRYATKCKKPPKPDRDVKAKKRTALEILNYTPVAKRKKPLPPDHYVQGGSVPI